jgi:hypothetical protein
MATRLNVLEGRFEGSSRNGDRGCVEHAITLRQEKWAKDLSVANGSTLRYWTSS